MTAQNTIHTVNEDYVERYGFADAESMEGRAPKGLTRDIVKLISAKKNEPDWMARNETPMPMMPKAMTNTPM